MRLLLFISRFIDLELSLERVIARAVMTVSWVFMYIIRWIGLGMYLSVWIFRNDIWIKIMQPFLIWTLKNWITLLICNNCLLIGRPRNGIRKNGPHISTRCARVFETKLSPVPNCHTDTHTPHAIVRFFRCYENILWLNTIPVYLGGDWAKSSRINAEHKIT